jgi:cyclopropane fatty-acyl-phospholipid synthase-like methyltransferase
MMREERQPPVSAYSRELSGEEIAAGAHRELAGGLWDEIGPLQFYFLRSEGLRPEHTLVDIGCGALRGGVHFVAYLDEGNYCGIDRNRSLIAAGRHELDASRITRRRARLLLNDNFELALFGVAFDYALAISLFTHLPAADIARCLRAVSEVLEPHGRLYASFFQAPRSGHVDPIWHTPGGITSYFGADPFHYSSEEMASLGAEAGLAVRLMGDWRHPQHQQMLCFTRRH